MDEKKISVFYEENILFEMEILSSTFYCLEELLTYNKYLWHSSII